MKKAYILLSAALFAAGCATEISNDVQSDVQTRTLTIRSTETRTTIEYEGSDVSHLVWCDGDEVAYCTDAASDTFKTAPVTSNSFKAEVPDAAQTIIVIYPAGDNAGKTLAQASASLASETEHNADTTFDGSLLPMMAVAPIPEDTDEVNVVYECLASIIRFTVYPSSDEEGDAVESIKRVTLSANESMTGTFSMGLSGSLDFTGSGKSVAIDITGTPESLLLSNHPVCYAVVNRTAYSGVNVKVETDLATYEFKDGNMDVSHPERTLYRVDLDLSTVTPEGGDVPEEPYFTLVTSVDDIMDDGVYLIASDKGKSEYWITDNKPTDTSNYYWLAGVNVSRDEYGICATDELMGYVCNITRHTDGYKIYFPNLVKNGVTGVELISQGGTGEFSQHDGEGKAWYMPTSTVDTYAAAQQPRRYWDISVNSDGTAFLVNKYDRGNDKKSYYKFCTDHNWFTLCNEGEKFNDIHILKLKDIEQ
ncbi:MAG: hypothetical protein IJ005_04940 [Bacteroidales bacterium]|nr:hypothetical protein [Bacteroidales bacterium]